MSNGTRPTVTRITVEFSDAASKTYPDNGYMPVGLFWGDDAVINILGAYYRYVNTNHAMTYENLEKHFGPIRANAVCPGGPGSSVVLTQDVITTIWNKPNQVLLLPLMSKDPGCDAGG